MLLLVFEAGGNRYGLDAREVVEVAPYALCRPLPQAPAYVAGLAGYRGNSIPVIDLSTLLAGTPARRLLSTRLIVVSYPCGDGQSRPLGLLAENAIETVRCREDELQPLPVELKEAPYLGQTVRRTHGLIQRVTVAELLPPHVKAVLFPEREAA
jgi:chemotaxis-related protein WspB